MPGIQARQQRPARLRIAMVTETYPPEVNGVARTLGRFVEGLRKRDHSVQLVRPRQDRSERAAAACEFEEFLVPGLPIPRYAHLRIGLPAKNALLHAWTGRRPDLVHIATEGPLGWSALSAAKALDLPVSTAFHTDFHAYSSHYGADWLAPAIEAYLRRFHNRADCTAVPTEELAQSLSRRRFARLRVVGRGIDAQVFSPTRRSAELRRCWGAGENTLVVLCAGRFAREKNLPLAIDAFREMRATRADARLVLLGEGPLAGELARMNIAHVLAGRRADADLAAHYASADVFLLPSRTETFGNVTLEAMASGLAIVAFDYAAARQYLAHDRSGLLAPFNEPAWFIEHAARLARRPGRITRLGAEARRIAEHLSWDVAVRDFERMLAEVAFGRAGNFELTHGTA